MPSLNASPSSSAEPVITKAVSKSEKTEETIAPFEHYLPWVILALSLITRYWAIAEPAGVVFDEVRDTARSRGRERAARKVSPPAPLARSTTLAAL